MCEACRFFKMLEAACNNALIQQAMEAASPDLDGGAD